MKKPNMPALSGNSAMMALAMGITVMFTACSDDSDHTPAIDIGAIDLGVVDLGSDLNCSFSKWCRKIQSTMDPHYYGCFQDKQGNYNPCCPKKVGLMNWRGCKVGIDASVVFANGCAPPGWFHCEAGVKITPDAGAAGQ